MHRIFKLLMLNVYCYNKGNIKINFYVLNYNFLPTGVLVLGY